MKKAFFYSFLLLVIMLLFSCNQEKNQLPPSLSGSENADQTRLFFENAGAIKFDGHQGDYHAAIQRIDHHDFQKVIQRYEELTGEGDKPRAITFFTSTVKSDIFTFSDREVIAISTYTIVADELHYCLYQRDGRNGDLVKNEYFSCLTDKVRMNDIEYILRDVLQPQFDNQLSYLLFLNKEESQGVSSRNELALKFLSSNNGLISHRIGGRAECPAPCPPGDTGDCEEYVNPEGDEIPSLVQCIDGPCMIETVGDSVQVQGDFSQAFIEENLKYDKFYHFRDGFLKKTTIGNKYIDYYYAISTYLRSDWEMKTIVKMANILPEINKAVVVLSDPENNAEYVLIDDNFSAKTSELLLDLKTKSDNIDYLNIIDDIQADLSYFRHKSVAEIIDEIE